MTLLSIIIPTHNRARYALEAIASLLKISSTEIQVVVCDSSPVDGISGELSESYPESRLKIVRTEKSISVVDNFNLGLEAADGEYLVFIGDDDFVTAETLDVARWAMQNNVESVKFNFPALYYWDDYRHATRGDTYSGTLHIAPFTGKITKHDLSKSVDYALKNFGGGVFEMPRAYAGMISSSLARRISKKYGALFGGVSPDIYSSLLISQEAESCVIVDYPAIIPGASGGSTTGQSNSGGHFGELRDNAHIGAFKNLVWDEKIPEFYAVPTVWSYSLLKALERVESVTGKKFYPDFSRLLLKCFAYYPRAYRRTLVSLKALVSARGAIPVAGGICNAMIAEFVWGMSRIYGRYKSRKLNKSIEVFDTLPRSGLASEKLGEYLRDTHVVLDFKDIKI